MHALGTPLYMEGAELQPVGGEHLLDVRNARARLGGGIVPMNGGGQVHALSRGWEIEARVWVELR